MELPAYHAMPLEGWVTQLALPRRRVLLVGPRRACDGLSQRQSRSDTHRRCSRSGTTTEAATVDPLCSGGLAPRSKRVTAVDAKTNMKCSPGLDDREPADPERTDRDTGHSVGKRICMIAYTHYRYDPRVRRAAEAFASRGDTVDFISLSEDSTSDEETINRVRITPLGLGKYRGSNVGNYVFGYIRFLLAASWTVMRRHLQNRYDVIYVHTMPDFMVFASLPAKLMGAKVILDVHDTMPELWQSKFGVSERNILRSTC